MSWEVTLNSELSLIELALSGDVSSDEFMKSTDYLVELAISNSVSSMYYDCRDVRSGPDVSDIVLYVRSLSSRGLNCGQVKKAILTSNCPAVDINLKFWEDCCYNRGVRAQLFSDRASALTWLACG